MSPLFTLEEANALLPQVTETLARTTQLLARARGIGRRLAEAGVVAPAPGEMPDLSVVSGDDELAQQARTAGMLLDAALEEAQTLQDLGVLIRDLERGLVDFRTIHNGEREAFLCWALGERDIQYFHGIHDGFVGRKSIEGHRFFRSRQLVPPRSTE